MSQATPVDQSHGDAALITNMLRRRESTDVLYWRLKRPRARVYVGAVIRLVLYRAIAGAVAIAGLALLTLAGVAAGNIGYPRWSAFENMNARMVHAATIEALSGIGHLAPVVLALSLPLIIVPRPPRWLSVITQSGGAAAGYFQQVIPSFQVPALANAISHDTASLNSRIAHLVSTTSLPVALIPFTVAALAGYFFGQSAYRLAGNTVKFIPHRPASHYRSTFSAISTTRRATAAILIAGLLTADLWIAVNLRTLSPAVTDVGSYYWRQQLSPLQWAIIIIVAAVIICAPRPQGHKGLLEILLAAVTVYAVWPHRIFPVPNGIPAIPSSFWMLVVIYIAATGVMFDGAAALLDWRS